MPRTQPKTRTFRVHARHVDAHHARTLGGTLLRGRRGRLRRGSARLPGDAEEISVIVREVESGHEHCFRIDLETGETSPCG